MRLIHCADLHLDSRLNTHLDGERAKQRRGELLHTFERMVEYAARESVDAILIAGDLFDRNAVSSMARNTVLHQIRKNPGIGFFYLRGNHDDADCLVQEQGPENLHTFETQWKTYELGRVTISGLELSRENAGSAFHSLILDSDKINIVMLHGQESEGSIKDNVRILQRKELRNRGIDYLALGHIHEYQMGRLDTRGVYCYPGCLEGRGFDECGEHGFVLLEVDEKRASLEYRFIPFAERTVFAVETDVTGCSTTAEMMEKVRERIREMGCTARDLLKIVLTGIVDVECEKDPEYIRQGLQNDFYYVKVEDDTGLRMDLEDYRLDASLKGEFVRTVMNAAELSEEEKTHIIRYGLQAIAGEEVQ